MARLLLASLVTPSGALQLAQNPQEARIFGETGVQSTSRLAREMGCSLYQETLGEQALFFGKEAQQCTAFEAHGSGALGSLLGEGGVDYVSLIRTDPGQEEKQQMAIWVAGYPRSGSSTLLSMVSATVDNNRDGGQTFSLFEPCHDGDEYAEWKGKLGCKSLLKGLTTCDFEGIKDLWGWRDPHSTNNYTTFSADAAHDLCKEADVVAFKTVDYGHDLKAWKWLYDSHPKMRVIDVVRDPRGIYASWKALEPFASLLGTDDFYTLAEVCTTFAKNLNYQDDRVHTVLFEDLLNNPAEVTKKVYDFLGLPYTEIQEQWVHEVFEKQWCPPPGPGMEGFTDCHVASKSGDKVIEKWHEILSPEEKAEFVNNEHCRRVAEHYGYPL